MMEEKLIGKPIGRPDLPKRMKLTQRFLMLRYLLRILAKVIALTQLDLTKRY